MITVTISGRRAVGKTTLAWKLFKLLDEEGHNVRVLNVDEGHGNFRASSAREIVIREINNAR